MAYGEKVCSCCGKEKALNNFFVTMNDHHNKYYHMCKSCITSCYKDNLKHLENNEGAAIWATCSEIGVPFIREVWIATKSLIDDSKTKEGPEKVGITVYLSFFNDYVNRLKMESYAFYQSDTMLDELIKVEKKDEFYKDQKELELDWGVYLNKLGQVDQDAYDYLEFTFEEYTRELEEMSPVLIRRYRDLCKAEWRKRKADETGEAGDIQKAQKDIADLMKLLKIDNFQEDNSKDEIHKFLEYNIWEIENTKPAECEDLEKYRDYCGGKGLIDSLMRPFRNILAGTREYPNITKD